MKPKFIWVESVQRYDYQDIKLEEILGCRFSKIEPVYVSWVLKAKYPNRERFALHHSVIIYIRGEGELDGSPRNLSITVMDKKDVYPFKGPALVASQPGTMMEPGRFQDVNCGDLGVLGVLGAFFSTYRTKPEDQVMKITFSSVPSKP